MGGVASTTVVPGPMVVRMLPSRERDEARRLWLALEAEIAEPALSCSWVWTGTWLEHYGDVVAHRFLIAERSSRPCGIALVTEAPPRLMRPRAWHLGTAGEPPGSTVFVERNRLLVGDGERAGFAAALIEALEAEPGWDRLRLDGLHAEDSAALLAACPAAVPRTLESPVADLLAGDDVLAGLSGSRRQRVRRTLKAFGELEHDWAATVGDANAILDELIVLHQQRWQEAGAPGAFASPRFVAFHRALIARLVPEGRAALVRVRRGEETVGCLYGLLDGRRMLFYQSGLRLYEDNRLRAGTAAHVEFMRACRARGVAEYDFLAPAARYKEELATRSDQLVWAEVARPTWRTRLAGAIRGVRGTR
ncbi:MAG: hypothetical protein JWQ48_1123 [Conexibacter sp.]|jgi:hypothetical protein|nr:hypothetical protein [Conexibacter sp.]